MLRVNTFGSLSTSQLALNIPSLVLLFIMRKKLLIISAFIIVVCLIFIGYSVSNYRQNSEQKVIKIGTEKNVDKNDFNYCDNDDSCIWYVENQGDPAGRIHCTGTNYSQTCSSCEKLTGNALKSLQSNFRCFCNANNRCQESR